MRPRAVLLRLAVGLTVASASMAAPSDAVAAIPDEPGAVVLPDAPILQAVVADLDGDGSRELIRLSRGEAGSAYVEVWRLGAAGWATVGDPVQVVEPMELLAPGRVGPWEPPDGRPLRMLVHRADGAERVLIATQLPILEVPCGCLSLHALRLDGRELRLVEVAERSTAVDGILVIDLDGDGTDELLAVLSLAPLGDISYPTEARVYRWADGAFGAPTVTELPVGSGDTPIHIGDSDGRPGDEAAFLSTLGPPGLFRIVLGPDDGLSVDRLREVVTGVLAVPMPQGTAIATASGANVSVRRWPAFSPPEERLASATVAGAAELVGVVELDGEPTLIVQELPTHRVLAFALPELEPVAVPGAFPRLASRAFEDLPVRPYLGPVPGWGPNGRDAIMAHGMIAAPGGSAGGGGVFEIASLAGAQPLGTAGDGSWIAILHAPGGLPPPPLGLGGDGGAFRPLTPLAGAWLSVVPRDLVLVPDPPFRRLDLEIDDVQRTGPDDPVLVGPEGFTVTIDAPPGSRVTTVGVEAEADAPAVVPDSGTLGLGLRPASERADPTATIRAAILVTTPAGRSHVARWQLQVLAEPPPLAVEVTTSIGSPEFAVSGDTAPYASVTVDGQPVEVGSDGRFSARVAAPPWPTEVRMEAIDFVGNTARDVVSGIGWFDYRGLPWLVIVGGLVAAAAVILYLRAPRGPAAVRVEDDARLEDLEPD